MSLTPGIEQIVVFILYKISVITGWNEYKLSDALITLCMPLICLLIEAAVCGWKNSSLYILSHDFKIVHGDLFCFFLGLFKLFDFSAHLLTFGMCYWLVGLIQKNMNLQLIYNIQNEYLQFALAFVASDFKNYFRHWVFHRVSFLWPLHKYHHSAEKFTLFSSLRMNAVEVALHKFFDVLPLVLLGVPFKSFAFIFLLKEVHQYLIHSNLKSSWGFIGKYIIMSPAHHRLHHSNNASHYGKNIGNTLVVWDHLFGTYHDPVPDVVLGLDKNETNRKFYFVEIIKAYLQSIHQFFSAITGYKK